MSEAWLLRDSFEDKREENRREPNVPVSLDDLAEFGVLVRRMDPSTMLTPTINNPDAAPAAEGAESSSNDPPAKISEVDYFARLMNYKNRDQVYIHPDRLPNYDEKLKNFFAEHVHEDEEIRLVLEGSGYFDIRGWPPAATTPSALSTAPSSAKADAPTKPNEDKYAYEQDDAPWIRILVRPGDLIIVPEGIYHRYTLDSTNFIHAMRLFSETPRWVPLNKKDNDGYGTSFVDSTVENPSRRTYVSKYLLPRVGPNASALATPHSTPVGPEDGQDTVYVANAPRDFDAAVRAAIKRLAGSSTGAPEQSLPPLLVFYFSGSHYVRLGKSWCPDCVRADPIVDSGVHAVRQEGRHVIFIYCPVERVTFMKNPNNFYRKHPFVELCCVPTTVVATTSAAAAAAGSPSSESAAAFTFPTTKEEDSNSKGPKETEEAEEGGIHVLAKYDDEGPPEDWLSRVASQTLSKQNDGVEAGEKRERPEVTSSAAIAAEEQK